MSLLHDGAHFLRSTVPFSLVPPSGLIWWLLIGLAVMRRRTLDALRAATRDGAIPVICDAASCTEGIVHALEEDLGTPLTVIDAVQFVADRVLRRGVLVLANGTREYQLAFENRAWGEETNAARKP